MKGDKNYLKKQFLNLLKTVSPHTPKLYKLQHKKHKKNDTKHIIIKLLKIPGKEKILKATR